MSWLLMERLSLKKKSPWYKLGGSQIWFGHSDEKKYICSSRAMKPSRLFVASYFIDWDSRN
jgi:hypothetical protein